jgi:ferrous iron transport protein B
MLSDGFFYLEDKLTLLFHHLNAPAWLHGILILGLFRTMAWVISVMLPPMAIFFPLFTILEDLGYLPRVAFNMDHLFKKACAHGKQCLSMAMGFGCNAAGIISCRIIESPRERLIAILTNNFVPCNGRFPTLIAVASVFLAANTGLKFGLLPALTITGLILVGILVTLLVSYGLSKTLLKGIPSTFTLELPPYRVPQVGRVLYTSIIDRTLFVLWRAVAVAAPAGIVIWILANIQVGGLSIIGHAAAFLNPFGKLIGLDGYILLAFILGLPANEIVVPILIMCYLSTGSMVQYDSLEAFRSILLNNGWTYLTALNVMLFSLLHWPCATTLLTIKKETGSIKWTVIGAVLPTGIAVLVCLFTATLFRLFGWA